MMVFLLGCVQRTDALALLLTSFINGLKDRQDLILLIPQFV